MKDHFQIPCKFETHVVNTIQLKESRDQHPALQRQILKKSYLSSRSHEDDDNNYKILHICSIKFSYMENNK